MEKIILNSSIRETIGKSVSSLRRSGLVPAVVYGKNKQNVCLSVNLLEFNKVYKNAGKASILQLKIEGDGSKNVLIHKVDFNTVTDEPIHIDFYEVSMKEKITASVPVRFVGDSIAVMDLGGSLVTNKSELEIECLPADLPHEIEVDIAALDSFDKAIHVKDIVLPDGVEIKDELDEVIVTVEEPRTQEEMEELEEKPEEPVVPQEESEESKSE